MDVRGVQGARLEGSLLGVGRDQKVEQGLWDKPAALAWPGTLTCLVSSTHLRQDLRALELFCDPKKGIGIEQCLERKGGR